LPVGLEAWVVRDVSHPVRERPHPKSLIYNTGAAGSLGSLGVEHAVGILLPEAGPNQMMWVATV
jgi:hypothetical protein